MSSTNLRHPHLKPNPKFVLGVIYDLCLYVGFFLIRFFNDVHKIKQKQEKNLSLAKPIL